VRKGPSQLLVFSPSKAHDAHGPSIRVNTLTKSLFNWKTAVILTGMKLATLLSYLTWPLQGFFPGGFLTGVSSPQAPSQFPSAV